MSRTESTDPPTYSGVCVGCDTYYAEIPLSDVDTSHGYKTIRCSVCPSYVGVAKEIPNEVTLFIAVLLLLAWLLFLYVLASLIVGHAIGF